MSLLHQLSAFFSRKSSISLSILLIARAGLSFFAILYYIGMDFARFIENEENHMFYTLLSAALLGYRIINLLLAVGSFMTN